MLEDDLGRTYKPSSPCASMGGLEKAIASSVSFALRLLPSLRPSPRRTSGKRTVPWPRPERQPPNMLVKACLVQLLCLGVWTASAFPLFQNEAPSVDLGYGIYRGVANEAAGVNVFKGIRYAAAPIGKLRWQLPQSPAKKRDSVIDAKSFGPKCPQSWPTGLLPMVAPLLPAISGDEDCLFLNVWAPRDAHNLPVMVWIHGGGYGQGDGQQDMMSILAANNNSFIVVSIQYRLGAFGFLASDDVHRHGVLNAGLHDQQAALRWVQEHIGRFGGDRRRVTVYGQSAGGGSVMLQAMAYGGTQGTELFSNLIASSPYLPLQWGYSDAVPTRMYHAFVESVGCNGTGLTGYSASSAERSSAVFDCLVKADTAKLQRSSHLVSSTQSTYLGFAFVPVTDGHLVETVPSRQLGAKRVNGRNILVGNDAEDGAIFVPRNITVEADVVSWLKNVYPTLSQDNITALLDRYPSSDSARTQYATPGVGRALTANDVASTAVSQLARASNIYAEATFACPSYWLADAFQGPRKAYHYQYSVVAALHGVEVDTVYGSPLPSVSPGIAKAVQRE
ncbi:uncharacterized protein PFL1_01223 [Pseudozyma flocculosa PF-1]|uniref:uncharacterized protein n=1 Tax=Pseudozyma flocculosa PF-1 TaxID=1277687 RepID=UPI0004560F7B|nr:uncharacterized protein PFL1_01223 [Pseudozyma flocculosa PF-1]EPQ31034.1 hypothetical protein PFL1_01223 [Pseudozyma flocculosa PF-1]